MQSGYMKIVILGRCVGFGCPLSYIPIWGHKAGILFLFIKFENETMSTFWRYQDNFQNAKPNGIVHKSYVEMQKSKFRFHS
jgi:hypothetical protein